MESSTWNQKFLSSTRGQVVQLLRHRERTVGELAAALDVTSNAVRSHLATLERDGLVRQVGERPGVRKPESVYGLTAQAEQLFPKAYGLLLRMLLDEVANRMPAAEVTAMLEAIGRQLAAEQALPEPSASLGDRIRHALDVLKQLGGLADVTEEEGAFVLCGRSCPLAEAVAGHPDVCLLAETLLAELTGTAVQAQCRHTEGRPQCVFVVPT